jgi:hypothetical protein
MSARAAESLRVKHRELEGGSLFIQGRLGQIVLVKTDRFCQWYYDSLDAWPTHYFAGLCTHDTAEQAESSALRSFARSFRVAGHPDRAARLELLAAALEASE